MVIIALTRLLADGCRSLGIGSHRILAGMLAVSAMAVQSALLHLALIEAPSTVTMTVNVARLTLDVVEMLRGHDGKSVASARLRARQTWPVVAGFAMGCGLAAVCQAAIGQWSLALPAGLALLAIGS